MSSRIHWCFAHWSGFIGTVICVLLVIGGQRSAPGLGQPSDRPARTVVLRFNRPLVPERMLFLPPGSGQQSRVVVCLGQEPGERFSTLHPVYRIVFLDESLLLSAGLSRLTGDGLQNGHAAILGDFSLVAEHDIELITIDLDRDGEDEVLCSGGGGAGGTGMLQVFKIDQNKVKMIYHDTSRNPLVIFRTDIEADYSIANAGFEFAFRENTSIMRPKGFTIYKIAEGIYKKEREVEGRTFERTIGKLRKRWGPCKGPPHVEIYEPF